MVEAPGSFTPPSSNSFQLHPFTTPATTGNLNMSSADPEKDLSPAEIADRDREEQERKAREIAEQAQLPYKWTQSIRDVDVTAPIPTNIKGRDMDVVLTKTKIRVGIKGQEPIIEVRPPILMTPSLIR